MNEQQMSKFEGGGGGLSIRFNDAVPVTAHSLLEQKETVFKSKHCQLYVNHILCCSNLKYDNTYPIMLSI